MRLAIAAASAVLITSLAVPAAATYVAADINAATDLSAAKKKKKTKAPKEEYLRAAPMAPPEGQKKK
jgi:hypothetical protein